MTDYERSKIKEFQYWTLFLHSELYTDCLGSVYLWARREDDVDIMEMRELEREEFFVIGRQVKTVLRELFKPDRFNYAAFQNQAHHLHVHLIPRYETSRLFDRIIFTDRRWGFPPESTPTMVVPEPTLLNVRDAIRKKLEELL